MSKIKDENFYQVQGWMLNRLNLKGVALSVFAIIYGFSQDGTSEFNGGRQYLCDFTNSTKPTIDKALNDLFLADLIIKKQIEIQGVKLNSYRVNLDIIADFTTSKEILPVVKNEEEDSKNFTRGGKEILQGGSKETLPNNKNNINNKESKKENINNNIKEYKEKMFFENDDLNKLFNDFLEMRKKIKKPATETAIKLLLDKLNKQENDDIRKKMLEKSIVNCWQGLFELSRDEKDKLEKEKWDNLPEEEKQAELDKLMKEFEDL